MTAFIRVFFCFLVSIVGVNAVYASTEKVFQDKIQKLKLEIDSGSVRVIGSLDQTTKVTYTAESKSCKMEIADDNGTLVIRNLSQNGGCKCDYIIYLPEAATVGLEIGATDKTVVESIKGHISVDIGAGHIEFSNNDADITANIGSGAVKYVPRKPQAPRTLTVAGGSLALSCILPKESSIKKLPEQNFMTSVSSSVKEVSDGSHDFVIDSSIGVGSVTIAY